MDDFVIYTRNNIGEAIKLIRQEMNSDPCKFRQGTQGGLATIIQMQMDASGISGITLEIASDVANVIINEMFYEESIIPK